MSHIALTKIETSLLTEAAGQEGGRLEVPAGMKPTAAQRTIGKLLKHELVLGSEQDGETVHHLTPAGYRGVGLKPPRRTRASGPAGESHADVVSTVVAEPRSGTKQALILGLLGRGQGASLDELIAATGWLPHTTRAALSRLRKAGTALLKSTRPDGKTAYRIVRNEPEPVRKRGQRRIVEAEVVAAA